MNEVSIIINGTRYDAVEQEHPLCEQCDIISECQEGMFNAVYCALVPMSIFKKSDKKFEK